MGARDDDKNLNAAIEMAASSVGADLLKALLNEISLLPKPWQQMTKHQQDEVIGRLRPRVEDNVRRGFNLIGAQGRKVVDVVMHNPANTSKGIKATVIASPTQPAAFDLFPLHGQTMLLVLGSASDVMGDTEGIKGEDDQRGLGLGHEYDKDSDGKGMEGCFNPDEGKPAGDPNVIDGGITMLPYDPPKPLDAHELETAYQAGRTAASQGLAKTDVPTMRHELVTQWMKGFNDWHEENGTASQPAADTPPADVDPGVDTDPEVLARRGEDDEPEHPVTDAPPASASKAKPTAKKAAAKKPAAKKGRR